MLTTLGDLLPKFGSIVEFWLPCAKKRRIGGLQSAIRGSASHIWPLCVVFQKVGGATIRVANEQIRYRVANGKTSVITCFTQHIVLMYNIVYLYNYIYLYS